jgi:hypothetical protein
MFQTEGPCVVYNSRKDEPALPARRTEDDFGMEVHFAEMEPSSAEYDASLLNIECICSNSAHTGQIIQCTKCYTWQHCSCYYPDGGPSAARLHTYHACHESVLETVERTEVIRESDLDKLEDRHYRELDELRRHQEKELAEPGRHQRELDRLDLGSIFRNFPK